MHLQSALNERYQVIHELGSGGYANVWLCRDMSANASRYVSTKIIMTDGSTAECAESRVIKRVEAGYDRETTTTYLSLPLDQFESTDQMVLTMHSCIRFLSRGFQDCSK